jgi:hypothetical protein
MDEHGLIEINGYVSNLYYNISGPEELVHAVSNFIRNLTKMHGGINRSIKVVDKHVVENKVNN